MEYKFEDSKFEEQKYIERKSMNRKVDLDPESTKRWTGQINKQNWNWIEIYLVKLVQTNQTTISTIEW